MATAALIDDRLHIDMINPYTATGTFGVSHDGFYKDAFMDGSYTTQIDETPMAVQDSNSDLSHFNPLHENRSGPMYLGTTYVHPAPDSVFPARKYQYDSGEASWARPGRPAARLIKKTDRTILYIVIIVLLLYIFRKKIKI